MSGNLLLDPTASPEPERIRYVPRPKSLDGLRLGLVDNGKHNALAVLKKIAERLDERHRIKVVHTTKKFSPAHNVDERDVREFKTKADFVIAGVGD